MVTRKTSAILLIITLFLMVNSSVALIFYARGRNITVICPANSNIMFQNRINKTVLLTVDSGLLNCSDGNIRVYDAGGSFRFTALNNTEITITFTVDQLKVQGDQNRSLRRFSSGNSIMVQTANNIFITWTDSLEPFLPIMFIIGIIGLISMIGGSLYSIDKLRKGEYVKGLSYGTIYVSLGISFFLAWLWAGVTV